MVMATSGGMVADDGRRCASTSSYPKTQPRTVSDRVVLTLVSSDELQRNVEVEILDKGAHLDLEPLLEHRARSILRPQRLVRHPLAHRAFRRLLPDVQAPLRAQSLLINSSRSTTEKAVTGGRPSRGASHCAERGRPPRTLPSGSRAPVASCTLLRFDSWPIQTTRPNSNASTLTLALVETARTYLSVVE